MEPSPWPIREPPRPPVGVLARGPSARHLADRLLAHPERLDRLRGVSGPDLLVLLGEADDLPWVDGVLYLGRDPEAPSLLLPTTRRPELPAALLERAVARTGLAAPCLLLDDPPLLLSVAAARPVDADVLRAWRGR